MVNVNAGVEFGVGWTDQSMTGSLESYAGPGSLVVDTAEYYGYLATTTPAALASATLSLVTTNVYVARLYIPTTAAATYADTFATTAGTVTVADAGLYSTTGAQLTTALTANLTTHTNAWGAGLNTWQFITPVTLQAGNYYYVAIQLTSSAAPSVAASPASPIQNINLNATTSDFSIYGTNAALPASLTLSTLVTNDSVLAKPWIGIR